MDSVPARPKADDDTQRPAAAVEVPSSLALWPTFQRRSLPSRALEPGQRREATVLPAGPEAA
jgi:hypothetical protein